MKRFLLPIGLIAAFLSMPIWAQSSQQLDLRPVLEEPHQLYLLDGHRPEQAANPLKEPIALSISLFKRPTMVLVEAPAIDYIVRLAQYDCQQPGKSLTLQYTGWKIHHSKASFDYSTSHFLTQTYAFAKENSPAYRLWEGVCQGKFDQTTAVPVQSFDDLTESYRQGQLGAEEKSDIDSFKGLKR